MLVVAQPIKWSAKISSETGEVLIAIYFENIELFPHVVEKPEGEYSSLTAVNYLDFNRRKDAYLHIWGQM